MRYPLKKVHMIDKSIRIFLADDHTIVRQGLAKLLEAEPGFEVIGEAKDGREAVNSVQKLLPDVVIMDIAMPMLNGIEATRQIKKMLPQIKIIILSMHSHDRYISELIGLGASGYLLKNESLGNIGAAIEQALAGGAPMNSQVAKRVWTMFSKMAPRRGW